MPERTEIMPKHAIISVVSLVMLLTALTAGSLFSGCAYHEHMQFEKERGSTLRADLDRVNREIAEKEAERDAVKEEIRRIQRTLAPRKPRATTKPSAVKPVVATSASELNRLKKREAELSRGIDALREERKLLVLRLP